MAVLGSAPPGPTAVILQPQVAMDAPAAAMITLVLDNGAGDAITMPREDARTKSDTLAGMLEGASHAWQPRTATPLLSDANAPACHGPRRVQRARDGACPQSRGRGQSSRVLQLALAAHSHMLVDASSPAPPTAPGADGHWQGFQRPVLVPAASEWHHSPAHAITLHPRA